MGVRQFDVRLIDLPRVEEHVNASGRQETLRDEPLNGYKR